MNTNDVITVVHLMNAGFAAGADWAAGFCEREGHPEAAALLRQRAKEKRVLQADVAEAMATRVLAHLNQERS